MLSKIIKCLVFLLSSFLLYSSLEAIVFSEFTDLSKEIQYGYVFGVVDSYIVQYDDSKTEPLCSEYWTVNGAWNGLVDFLNKNKEKKIGGINVSLIISLNYSNYCSGKKKAEKDIKITSLAEFTKFQRDVQVGYIVGVLDRIVIDAEYSVNRTKCVEEWGFKGFWSHLMDIYSQGNDNPLILNSNPAKILLEGAVTKCGTEKRDTSDFKPIE
jgi:hypothetical protein